MALLEHGQGAGAGAGDADMDQLVQADAAVGDGGENLLDMSVDRLDEVLSPHLRPPHPMVRE